ncbi:hypothetical protein [Phocaeicola plebeius]|uniref:hypothetical protein n=1 Tax=Phocaeicola plebeius TaxID=310297 RepID=UPI003F9C86B4
MKSTELQLYFKERIIELLHKDTLDSHRVRTHNVYSLIKELYELITYWKNFQIKQFETVQLCVEEVRDAIEFDTCLDYSFYSKNLFKADLDDFRKYGEKEPAKTSKILMMLDKCISFNEEKYLPTLILEIEKILFNSNDIPDDQFIPEIKNLDLLVSSFCCELLHKGYSKVHLFVFFTKLIEKNPNNFNNIFSCLKAKFMIPTKREFTIIFRLTIPQSILDLGSIPDIKTEIDEEYDIPENYKKFIKPAQSRCFYIHKCYASDTISAIKKSKEELASLLDILHLGMSKLSVEIPNTALVITTDGNNTTVYNRDTQFILDGSFSNDNSLSSRFKRDIDKIKNNKWISYSVKSRLESALRHLRVGDSSPELEQKFINYWIALEFIFSSSEAKESTFTRLKINLINILTSCYAKRNLLSLNETLISKREITSGTLYWERPDVEDFINNIGSPLIRYRLKVMKANLFKDKEKTKSFISKHESNLLWHLARIYRLRNELIHEAAIKHDIENVTSNLRYYLVFLLNQLIVYFENVQLEKNVTLENFFYDYESWKKRIMEEYNFDTIMSVPVELDLLK